MADQPYAAPITGVLTMGDSLIIYDDGYYSLDGGNTISADTIGPETQISAPSVSAAFITLHNSSAVNAKKISVPSGSLTIIGPGEIVANNQDVTEYSRISGIRVNGDVTITGGATVRAAGSTDGLNAVNILSSRLSVTDGSSLYGSFTGSNPTVLGAGKYGVYSGFSISVSDGGVIDGRGAPESYNSYGVFCDAGHNSDAAMSIGPGCSVTGAACVGVYLGGPTVVDGTLTGTGGNTLKVAHGIQGDRAGITVNPGGVVTAEAGAGSYAGIIMVYGYRVNNGTLTASGGEYGIRSAGSAGNSGILVENGGLLTGIASSQVPRSYGVYAYNGGIAIATGRVTGTGTRDGVFSDGDITVQDGILEGFTYAYGQEDPEFFGAVISGGAISAESSSQIIENYSRVEYFDEVYQIPYNGGKNISDYRNYSWTISSGTGSVSADAGGQGIHAVQSGAGTLTALRTGPRTGEVVTLSADSSHRINIPADLSVIDVPEYQVTYDGGEADGGTAPEDTENPYEENRTVTVLENTGGLFRDGFSFAGWLSSADNRIYHPGETFFMPAEDVTLTAQWTPLPPRTYTVTYRENGADGGTAPVDPGNPYEENDSVTVLDNSGGLRRAGYRFSGWSLDPSGSGTVYRPGDIFSMPAGNVTLYAVWQQWSPQPPFISCCVCWEPVPCPAPSCPSGAVSRRCAL